MGVMIIVTYEGLRPGSVFLIGATGCETRWEGKGELSYLLYSIGEALPILFERFIWYSIFSFFLPLFET